MIGYCQTGTFLGAEVCPIRVEAKTRPGKPSFSIIGLGDSAVRESRDRITSALRVSGFDVPDQILINLAPADVKKEGSGLDLAMALAILISDEQLPVLGTCWVFGELSLDGTVKPVKGIAGFASDAVISGVRQLIIPVANLREASLVPGVEIIAITNLIQLRDFLCHGLLPEKDFNYEQTEISSDSLPQCEGLSSVIGQVRTKEALIVAAAGGHNMLMVGPPGCGKSMLAERFSSLLPPLRPIERLECVRLASIIGEPIEPVLKGLPPYRAPHHVVSEVGMIGGGSDLRPGEISLAHNGVLFLDEFPEYQKSVLEALRAPLESGRVTITRAKGTATYPARFQLLAAMNPCPCGRFGMEDAPCRCTRQEIGRYLKKLSQPILERIDLQVALEPVSYSVLAQGLSSTNESRESKIKSDLEKREQVVSARKMQFERAGKLNSALSHQEIYDLGVSSEADQFLEGLAKRLHSSARLFVRTLRVARTIADLKGNNAIEKQDIAKASNYRALHHIWRYVEGS